MGNTADLHSKFQAGALRSILVASDLTAHSDRVFDRAAILARQNHAALHFVHVVDSKLLPDRYLQVQVSEAQTRFEHEVGDSGVDRELQTSVTVVSGEPVKAIVGEAQDKQAELVLMGLSLDTTLAGIIRGSTIDKVVRRAHCPVLVVKTRARRPYSKIAVAVDLSEPSRRAVDFALRIFPDAEFSIIHVDETTQLGQNADYLGSPAGIARQHQIEDMVTARFLAAGRDRPGTASGPVLVFGNGKAANVLQEKIAQLSLELVVMGTHTRTGVTKMFLGSVAETLLDVLPNDVLIVRT